MVEAYERMFGSKPRMTYLSPIGKGEHPELDDSELLMIEHMETSQDRRVALADKAVLHCECGAVAIITEEDVGNGRIGCPGASCGKRYCCKCGNDDHGTLSTTSGNRAVAGRAL